MTKSGLMGAAARFLRELAEAPGWGYSCGGMWQTVSYAAAECAGQWAEVRSVNRWTLELRVAMGKDRAWTYYRDYGGSRGMLPDDMQAYARSREAADILLARLGRYMGHIEAYAGRGLYDCGGFKETEEEWETRSGQGAWE